MIKIFYGSDGRAVLAKAIQIFTSTDHIVFFPEITTSARVGHSSMVRFLDIAVPASPADIAQVVKELVQIESDSPMTIYVATCSQNVIDFIQERCKECVIVEC